jgi:hypothetical protein
MPNKHLYTGFRSVGNHNHDDAISHFLVMSFASSVLFEGTE